LDTANEEMQKAAQTGSKIGVGSKTAEKQQQPANSNQQPSKQDQTALKQLIKQVYVTGDYDGIVALMKELENYQRVTGVKQVCVATASEKDDTQQITQNAAAEKAKKLELPPNRPVMSFLMSLYYLP
jgi:hypothetical protein